MKKEETDMRVSVSITAVHASQESFSLPIHRRTWGNDIVEEDNTRRQRTPNLGWKSRWSRSVQDRYVAAYRYAAWIMQSLLQFFLRTSVAVPEYVKKFRITRKQSAAFFMVLACGVAPFFILAIYTSLLNPFRPFNEVFNEKTLGCGNVLGTPQNATVFGIEKLFVLDKTFGNFSFSQVKTIDVFWDLLVGRGMQMCAWWAAYIVFSDALLRVIERNPVSFRIFQRIALEGPSLLSLWTLSKELWLAKNWKTKALFCYAWFSTTYILCIPVLLGAMTGYDSTNIAWLDMDDTNNIVPWSSMKESWLIVGTKNETFDQPSCKPYETQRAYSELNSLKYGNCDCQLANGTIVDRKTRVYDPDCTFNFPGATQTFRDFLRSGNGELKSCNATFPIDIRGVTYDASALQSAWGYCFNDIGYNATYLYDKTRCLPDTANPAYKWGFATMLSGLFVFLQFGWSLSMYVVWQDAQFNCALVKEGYQMTSLRAAFAIAKAAQKKTGLGEKALMRADTKGLERELYGGGDVRATQVDHAIFLPDSEDEETDRLTLRAEELRARHRRGVSEAALGYRCSI